MVAFIRRLFARPALPRPAAPFDSGLVWIHIANTTATVERRLSP
jgi:hypothetical protein